MTDKIQDIPSVDTKKKFKVIVHRMGGYMTEEQVVCADNEDDAFEMTLNSDDWEVTEDLEFKDCDIQIHEVKASG